VFCAHIMGEKNRHTPSKGNGQNFLNIPDMQTDCFRQ